MLEVGDRATQIQWNVKADQRALLKQMPKIDLHRHLEGSLRLQTLAEIAIEHGIDLPAYSIEKLRPYVQVLPGEQDFHTFLAKFRLLRKFYRSQEAVERVAYEAVADAAADNVRYLELRFNPVALSRAQGFGFSQVTGWVCQAIARAQGDHSIRVRLILQIGRDESLDTAAQIIQVAHAYRDRGVVGIDLAGDEINYPPHRFAELFSRAREDGLGITVHAGEAGGAQNVRTAVELLKAQRIGHGVRVVEDSTVVHFVRQQQVAFEVCPTSNFQTGVVRSLTHHPLPDMLALKLPVTINTDDPSISDTTLTDEYLVATEVLGLSMEQIEKANLTAIDAAFLPEEEKDELRKQFEQWYKEQPQAAPPHPTR